MSEQTIGKILAVAFASNNVNASEEYSVVETTAVPGLTTVRFYEETIQHVKKEHGRQFPVELPVMLQAVANAIKQPTSTATSHTNSIEFVHSGTTNANGHPLRAYVRKVENTSSGRLSTFFFAGEEDANG